MTASNAPDFAALGIAGSGVEIMEAAVSEPTLVAEAAERAARRLPPVRRRAGPLPLAERQRVCAESAEVLKRVTLGLLLATDSVAEVNGVLAKAGLTLRTFPPTGDQLAAQLGRGL